MMPTALMICYIGLFAATLLSIIRLILGPTTLDRILAFDSIALCAGGMAILFSAQTSSVYFLEVLLILCLLGFTTVLGYLDYLGQDNRSHDKE